VGKVCPGFQLKCEAWLLRYDLKERALKERWIGMESDHAKVSQGTVQAILGRSGLRPWAAALGAHHGRLKGEQVPLHKHWDAERRRLAEELIREFGPLPDQPPEDNEALLWVVAGLITVADWIGSDEQIFPQDATWDTVQRRQQARSALHAIGWRRASARSSLGFGELFPELTAPNDLQTAGLQAVGEPGVYVIEGPMGCGKTEVALGAAYQLIAARKATGLYFALPTQVTSNRIHLRVQPFLERVSEEPVTVRLAHGASWLVEAHPGPFLQPAERGDAEARDHTRAGRSWFASAKRALLTPYGVGTIDQALLGVVAAKHFFVRQFGLAGKVVVLDEVHTYDLYTSTLVDVLVRRLRDLQCTVLILSATLTESRRRQLLGVDSQAPLIDAYPLLTGRRDGLVQVPCEPPAAKKIEVRFAVPADLIERVLERAEEGQCVLWIRNTVDDAQETYRCLQAARREGGPEIALLHSRFPFYRRDQLESIWMERLGKTSSDRPRGCILVSTQVAEQSVDIDSDLLVTDLAPTDMLLQRIGRLWRHERNRPAHWSPEVWLRSVPLSDGQLASAAAKELVEALGKSAKVYAPYVLIRSLAQWRARASLTLPRDLRGILEATYAEPAVSEPAGWRDLRQTLERQREALADRALSATRVWTLPPLPDEEDIQTRHTTYPSAGLLLAHSAVMVTGETARLSLLDGTQVDADPRHWSFDAARGIHRNLVRVPGWAVNAALRSTPGWLTAHVSQPTALGLVQRDGSIACPGGEFDSELSYHSDLGVVIERGAAPRGSREEFDESYD
jgi:CRISPR-associated endonuclease/helicase Cas3